MDINWNQKKKTLAICGSLNNTFKAANKATLTNKDRQKLRELKGGILSVLNEDNQIVSWVSSKSSNDSLPTDFPWFITTTIIVLLSDLHKC
jgi:hypothetical protein